MSIRYRAAEESDLNYIVASWTQGARNAERHTYITNRDYFLYYKQRVARMLQTCFVRVAYEDTTDPNEIASWCAYTFGPTGQLIIHYVYTKKALWGLGIAKGLIADIYPNYKTDPIICTTLFVYHHRVIGWDYDKREPTRNKNFTYNPYILEGS